MTKLPPAEQKVFFQEVQFDPDLSEGTDPIIYERGRPLNFVGKKGRGFKSQDPDQETQTQEAKLLRQAKEVLKGHKNEKEILKVLKSRNV